VIKGLAQAWPFFSILALIMWRGRPRRVVRLLFSQLETLPFEKPADIAYSSVRRQLERAGRPIGGNDLLIAAQALGLDYTVVTDNGKEYARVNGLRLENWLR
jgi:tRNA(fMet)-specific endonuclease VapC